MDFSKERYKPKVKFYQNIEFEKKFSQDMIDYFWFNKKDIKEKIELVEACDHRQVKVFKINHKDMIYYLKYYSYERISKKLENNLLRRPEGIRNVKIAKQLLEADLITPKPVFSAVKRNLICYDSLFVTLEAKEIELEGYIKKEELSGNKPLIRLLGIFWAKFTNNKFIHQDPGFDNLFISSKQEELELTVIDIDSIYSLPIMTKSLALHTIARFLMKAYITLFKNNSQLLTKKDIDLFLKEVIEKSKLNFNLAEVRKGVNKLLIKKITSRDKEHLINNSKYLTKL